LKLQGSAFYADEGTLIFNMEIRDALRLPATQNLALLIFV
jgi:hypothetical protein